MEPEVEIILTSKSPDYITAEIKSLVRMKNKLLQRDHVEKAEALRKRYAKALLKVTLVTLKEWTLRIGQGFCGMELRSSQRKATFTPVNLR